MVDEGLNMAVVLGGCACWGGDGNGEEKSPFIIASLCHSESWWGPAGMHVDADPWRELVFSDHPFSAEHQSQFKFCLGKPFPMGHFHFLRVWAHSRANRLVVKTSDDGSQGGPGSRTIRDFQLPRPLPGQEMCMATPAPPCPRDPLLHDTVQRRERPQWPSPHQVTQSLWETTNMER